MLMSMIQKPGWRKFLSHVGPGFLVSLAYLDPGNCKLLLPDPGCWMIKVPHRLI